VHKRIARARVTRRKSGGDYENRWEKEAAQEQATLRQKQQIEKDTAEMKIESDKLRAIYNAKNNTRRKYFTNAKTFDEISAVNQDWMDEIARLKLLKKYPTKTTIDAIFDIEYELHQRRMARIDDELRAALKKAKNSKAPGDTTYVDRLQVIRKKILQQLPRENPKLMDNFYTIQRAVFKDDMDELDNKIAALKKEIKTSEEKKKSIPAESLIVDVARMQELNKKDLDKINAELKKIKEGKISDRCVRLLEEKIKNEKQNSNTSIKLESMEFLLAYMKNKLDIKTQSVGGGFLWTTDNEIKEIVDKLIELAISIKQRASEISAAQLKINEYKQLDAAIHRVRFDLQSEIAERNKYIRLIE
jgi:hypothetical protein